MFGGENGGFSDDDDESVRTHAHSLI